MTHSPDIEDAIGEIAYVGDAVFGLAEAILSNVRAMDRLHPEGSLTFGPTAGLEWALIELRHRIKAAQKLVGQVPS
jgi:hypothetical protein